MGGQCFKTLSAGIYLEDGILRPNGPHSRTNPSRVGWQPRSSPFALAVSLKDGARLEMRSKRPGRAGSLGATFSFMLTLIINISRPISRCCRLFERSHFPGRLAQRGLILVGILEQNNKVLIIYLSPFLFHALSKSRRLWKHLLQNQSYPLALFAASAAYMPV